MEVSRVLCMNGGDGETSYANNSLIQKEVMFKAKPMIENSITKLYHGKFQDDCFKMADFGCSSGPNTLLLVWEIMDIMERTCKQLNRKAPMFQIFLNDLPGNDFNTIFRSLPRFYEKLKGEKGNEFGPCFIAGMPGNFYERLFPDNLLHFVHSSYSLQWRSQIPERLASEAGIPLNKGNIYLSKTSPRCVLKEYLDLFRNDFTKFLRLRSQEMVIEGYMVLIMIGSDRKSSNSGYNACAIWELLGTTLNDMVLEGLVEEAKLDWFNLPYYAPSLEEVMLVIQDEGSFNIQQYDVFEVDWDANIGNGDLDKTSSFDKHARGEYIAISIRVVAESILATHFGSTIIDDLFDRFARKITEYLKVQKGEYTNIAISMTKLG